MIEEPFSAETFIKKAVMRYGLEEGHSFLALRRTLGLNEEESALMREELGIV